MSEKNQISNLPVPSVGGLSVMAQLKVSMLDAEEEYMLAKGGENEIKSCS